MPFISCKVFYTVNSNIIVFRHFGLPPNAWIPINFRLDGNLFNIRWLQVKTKVSGDTIFDLQYADDAAIPSHTAAGLQHSLDLLATSYQRAGLIVNTKKTEVLAQSVNTSSAAHPTFTSLQFTVSRSMTCTNSPILAVLIGIVIWITKSNRG